MPKSQATTIVPCLTQTGRVCAALSALFLLPAAVAAVPEPSLRRSEQIDLRRLGKVSRRCDPHLAFVVGLRDADLRDDGPVDARGVVRAQVIERHGPERSRACLLPSRLFALRGARPDDQFQPSFAIWN